MQKLGLTELLECELSDLARSDARVEDQAIQVAQDKYGSIKVIQCTQAFLAQSASCNTCFA